jgi:ADP-ribose pyrophosphatase
MTTATSTDLDKVVAHFVEVGRTWSHPAPASAEQTRQRLHWAAEDLLGLFDGNSRLGPLELTHPWKFGGQVIGGDLRRMLVNGYPKGTGIDQQLLLASMNVLIHDHTGQTGPDPFAMGAFLTGFCRMLAEGANGISYQLVLVDVDERGQVVRRGEDLVPALTDVFAAAWARWMQQRGHTAAATEPAAGIAGVDPADPTAIDWPARQQAALIPFTVTGGRPFNPVEQDCVVGEGRGELYLWGENRTADAVVIAVDEDGHRHLLMVNRDDRRGWALPGGFVDDGEDAVDAAIRELREETGLQLPGVIWHVHGSRYVADSRNTLRAWIVTTVVRAEITAGRYGDNPLPAVFGGDDATDAAWLPADSVDQLIAELDARYDGVLFPAHRPLLDELLDPDETEAWLREHAHEQLDGRTPQQLRLIAERGLRLRAAIEMTMANLDDWYSDGTRVPDLNGYLRHLTQAHHGICAHCDRAIYASHPVTELQPRPAWHPGRWRHALRELGLGLATAWHTLRYGDFRVTHTSCRPPQHWS